MLRFGVAFKCLDRSYYGCSWLWFGGFSSFKGRSCPVHLWILAVLQRMPAPVLPCRPPATTSLADVLAGIAFDGHNSAQCSFDPFAILTSAWLHAMSRRNWSFVGTIVPVVAIVGVASSLEAFGHNTAANLLRFVVAPATGAIVFIGIVWFGLRQQRTRQQKPRTRESRSKVAHQSERSSGRQPSDGQSSSRELAD